MKATATVPAPLLSVVLANALDFNDTQLKRGDIDHQVWSDIYIALWTYAETHGLCGELHAVIEARHGCDALLRRAKTKANREGVTLNKLIDRLLSAWVEEPTVNEPPRMTLSDDRDTRNG